MSKFLTTGLLVLTGLLPQTIDAKAAEESSAPKVSVHNINIPDKINGEEIESSVSLGLGMSPFGAISLDLPPANQSKIFPLDGGYKQGLTGRMLPKEGKIEFNEITLDIYKSGTRFHGGQAIMRAECHTRQEKPIFLKRDPSDVLGISVSYDAHHNRVTCDITTPHK